MSNLITTTQPVTALAKDIKVTKSQLVMAAVQRYQERKQAQIDNFDFDARKDALKAEAEKIHQKLAKLLKAHVRAVTGIKSNMLETKLHTRNYTFDSRSELYIDVTVSICETDTTYRVQIAKVELCETSYSNAITPRLPMYITKGNACNEDPRIVDLLYKLLDTTKQLHDLKAEHTKLLKSLDTETITHVRQVLKRELKSEAQLADMQVARALVTSTAHCTDIDTALDGLGL